MLTANYKFVVSCDFTTAVRVIKIMLYNPRDILSEYSSYKVSFFVFL